MANPHYHGLILAGGRGTRFWPRSRRRSAKQVLRVVGERTLIQATVDRLRRVIAPERLWVLTNEFLRSEIVRQLPEIPAAQILAEPAQRNTAPAIGLAARILQTLDPEAVMGVFPADHVIGRPVVFQRILRTAFRAAAGGELVVLGIRPRWPETGYGYIEFPDAAAEGAVTAVRRFCEKPPLARARRFLASGRHYWNAGMFFWRTDVLLDQLRAHLPATAALLDSLPAFGGRKFPAALAAAFPRCENISIDFAVMERARKVSGIPCPDFAWNDVGSWNAVYELVPQDAAGNVVDAHAVCLDARGNYVDVPGKTVALLGVEDLIVVDTPDAILIAARHRAQDVGAIVKTLESRRREDLL